MLLSGLFGDGAATARMASMAGGAVLVFVGIALMARHIVRPVAALAGWPLERAFHTPGRLARENAMRNPGRTATTSSALMVGLGLVVFVAVFAAGMKATVSDSFDRLLTSDLIVTSESFEPLPNDAGDALAGVPASARSRRSSSTRSRSTASRPTPSWTSSTASSRAQLRSVYGVRVAARAAPMRCSTA